MLRKRDLVQTAKSAISAGVLTDSDTYFADAGRAQDQYNRRLEKSIGRFDQMQIALKIYW